MKKALVLVAMLALSAKVAQANIVNGVTLQHSDAPIMQSGLTLVVDDGTSSGTRTATDPVLRYDNWTTPPNTFTGIFLAGNNEIADDANMTAGGASLLDTMGFSVGNGNCAGTWAGGGANDTVTIRFYDSLGNIILDGSNTFGGFTAGIPAINAGQGVSFRLSFANGGLESLNWTLGSSAGGANPNNIFVSVQINNQSVWPAGCSSANFAMSMRAGPSVGTSADVMYNVTAGTAFNFNGNPAANMSLKIALDPVPEPATFGLLAIGALALIRRRS